MPLAVSKCNSWSAIVLTFSLKIRFLGKTENIKILQLGSKLPKWSRIKFCCWFEVSLLSSLGWQINYFIPLKLNGFYYLYLRKLAVVCTVFYVINRSFWLNIVASVTRPKFSYEPDDPQSKKKVIQRRSSQIWVTFDGTKMRFKASHNPLLTAIFFSAVKTQSSAY